MVRFSAANRPCRAVPDVVVGPCSRTTPTSTSQQALGGREPFGTGVPVGALVPRPALGTAFVGRGRSWRRSSRPRRSTSWTLAVPVAIGIAVVRHRLFGIDVVLNRTLVGTALLACSALVYVAVVGWLGGLAGTPDSVVGFVGAVAVAARLARGRRPAAPPEVRIHPRHRAQLRQVHDLAL